MILFLKIFLGLLLIFGVMMMSSFFGLNVFGEDDQHDYYKDDDDVTVFDDVIEGAIEDVFDD